MKTMKLTPIILTVALSHVTNVSGQVKTDKIDPKGISVLELFTSEGCSSCPPADELMGKIQSEYNDQVYVLSYHVDYWDHQGWKDIYSNADYTKRQYRYAGLFRSASVYTPQVVVNGKAEYIASRETIVRNAIKEALSKPAPAQLELTPTLVDNKLEVNYTVSGAFKNSHLLLAIVQKSAQSEVKRGENAHRVLSQFQIVHHLNATALTGDGKGTVILPVPTAFNTTDFEIIGFVQDINTGAVLGAARAHF